MKHLVVIISIFALLACDPIEAFVTGPEQLYIEIVNKSGLTLYEKDNWGGCDAEGNIFPSERVIDGETGIRLWNYMPGVCEFDDFLSILEDKCPDAYVELYAYDKESGMTGKLLNRWTLKEPEEDHGFFIKTSFFDASVTTSDISAGIFVYTVSPSDIGQDNQ